MSDDLETRLRELGEVRAGRFGPVLSRLLELELELGDAEAAIPEPAPFPELEPIPEPRRSPGGFGGAAPREPAWYEVPYAGGPMVKVAGFPRAVYPPDASSKGKKPSEDGPDVKAYKRTVCRLGRWQPWDPDAWDDSYSNAFAHGRGTGMVGDSGIAGVQRQQNVDPTGWIGEKTFNLLRSARVPTGPHAGDMAMDSVAVNLINQAVQKFSAPPPGSLADVERAITDYLRRSINAEPKWHYSQARAMTNLGKSPDVEQSADCSTQSTSAYFWAKQETGVEVPDPNGCGYNGYGYTGTLIDNPRVSSPYKVGDLALYGPSSSNTSHVCTCYLAGSGSTSEWCSHGSEAAPYPVDLHYRSDLLCVVRPGLMP